MATRTWGSESQSANASPRAPIMAPVRAFRASGRSRVMTAVGPCRSAVITDSSLAPRGPRRASHARAATESHPDGEPGVVDTTSAGNVPGRLLLRRVARGGAGPQSGYPLGHGRPAGSAAITTDHDRRPRTAADAGTGRPAGLERHGDPARARCDHPRGVLRPGDRTP